MLFVRVDGAQELQRLARDLKAAGDKDLRRKLYRGFQHIAKPVKAAAQQGALDTLPSSGGLAAKVAAGQYRVSVRSRGSGASLQLRVSAKSGGIRVDHKRKKITAGQMDLNAMDRGRLRHPVHGNRHVWVNQKVKPGWFTKSTARSARLAHKEALKVITEVARELAAKG